MEFSFTFGISFEIILFLDYGRFYLVLFIAYVLFEFQESLILNEKNLLIPIELIMHAFVIVGRLALGFSLTSPDLVCVGSPDITNQRYEESPEFFLGERIDVSLENGIEGSEIRDSFNAPVAKMEDLCTEASFELVASPLVEENLTKLSTTVVIGINVGSTRSVEFQGGLHFAEDSSFNGGDTVRTEDPIIGAMAGLSLYQTARFGNFSYHFENLEAGNYMVELHFAEIVFTAGPPGMRIFDVFLQGQKVISSEISRQVHIWDIL